jgi:5-hydroxyisourate hydrolase
MSLSTHVLDTASGRPAEGVPVILSVEGPTGWAEVARRSTDADGRITALLPAGAPLALGTTVRLRFELLDYFAGLGVQAFYPYVDVVFTLQDSGHHHVPLLVSPFGYSTYRGI